jgi:hypothetical protein
VFLLQGRYMLAFLNGDTAEMERLLASASGQPGTADVLLAAQSDSEAWYGKLARARKLTRQAMDSAQQNDAKEAAVSYQAIAALREVESGNRERGIADATAALKLAPNREVQAMAALAFARAGDISAAEKLAAELKKTYPLDTLVQKYRLPAIRAAVALQRKDPQKAIALLEVARSVEFGDAGYLLPAYLRGEAYLMLRNGRAARTEFQKLVDFRGLVGNFQWGALARLGLARGYALEAANDAALRGKARPAYQDFLNLWKDADPDIPIYRQAREEYARLQTFNVCSDDSSQGCR